MHGSILQRAAGRMLTTRDNPGAFRAATALGPRAILSKALRLARKRKIRGAVLGVIADTVNTFTIRFGELVPPRFHCPCCDADIAAFVNIVTEGRVTWGSACPRCDSRSRHRGLALLLPRVIAELAPRSVLHIAPEPILRRFFDGVRYETADLHLEDATHRGVDLQAMPFADGSYDMLVCNHVLEHVPDDGRALAEIRRVLTERGVVVITVPGDFSRAHTVSFTGELPNGHYRDYGRDFVPRLEAVFASVDVVDMHALDPRGPLPYGIRPGDLAFVCRRGNAASSR